MESKKGTKVQTDIILNCAGPHALQQVYDNVVWEKANNMHKPEIKVLGGSERYCNPRTKNRFANFSRS